MIFFDRHATAGEYSWLCVSCKYRFVSVRSVGVWMKDMECANCGEIGFVVATGQDLNYR